MTVILMMTVAMAFPSLAETSADSIVLQNEAVAAFNRINEIRKQNGLNEIRWMDELGPATMTRATEITTTWSHVRPNGSMWYTVDPNLLWGENLAEGYKTAAGAVNAWMASPSHKENILDQDYTGGNIQIVETNGHWYWANEFYEG